MQIKIFEYNGNNEAEVNAWLRENPSVKVISVTMQTMYDFYTSGTPQICNQWIATTVVYEAAQAGEGGIDG